MALLIQFLLRLSFGLAAGMAITSSKRVTSGYFRNHLYVTLGLTALAALLSRSAAPEAFWYALLAAGCSYAGAICWLYEKPELGKVMLLLVALTSMEAGFIQLEAEVARVPELAYSDKYLSLSTQDRATAIPTLIATASFFITLPFISSGLLLGMTMAAMLLGHWYLNSPTMELGPLRRLVLAMGAAVGLQVVVSSLGLWGELSSVSAVSTQWVLFVVLRWLFGLVGVAGLTWMAWQTLKIPNTQSTTGILYVAVIGTFVGETMALLLSRESLFPL